MKTEKELNEAIVKITMTIQEKYPELSKYITEMPITIPDEKHPDMSNENLQNYYDSLKSILKKYDVSHTPKEIGN